MSFSASQILELIPKQLSLVQYRRFFDSDDWMHALSNSLQVAVGTMVLATVLGVLAALALWRMSEWSRRIRRTKLRTTRAIQGRENATGCGDR